MWAGGLGALGQMQTRINVADRVKVAKVLLLGNFRKPNKNLSWMKAFMLSIL